MADNTARRYDRRQFLSHVSRGGMALAFTGGAASLLAACARDEPALRGAPATTATLAPTPTTSATASEAAAPIIGDVLDFALSSDQWEGGFGFVTLRLHRGVVDGDEVLFVRTDASDEDFAQREQLVYVPKLKPLARDGLSSPAYLVEGGTNEQAVVLSTQPGRDDYSPAWRIHRVTFTGEPRTLTSVSDVEAAESAGEVEVEQTDIIMNAAPVTWSGGELPVDTDLKAYLGLGPLIEAPDPAGLTVTFKLNQCYPTSWYFVTDHSIAPAAEMTHTVFAPGLQDGPTEAGATGRTNVLMNGIPGPGPMGFQPSAFDFAAGAPEWSPYWDHYAYRWKDESQARLLTSQREVHAARDAGELDEFPGMPDTNGVVFTVNCPVPVLAPNTFEA